MAAVPTEAVVTIDMTVASWLDLDRCSRLIGSDKMLEAVEVVGRKNGDSGGGERMRMEQRQC